MDRRLRGEKRMLIACLQAWDFPTVSLRLRLDCGKSHLQFRKSACSNQAFLSAEAARQLSDIMYPIQRCLSLRVQIHAATGESMILGIY